MHVGKQEIIVPHSAISPAKILANAPFGDALGLGFVNGNFRASLGVCDSDKVLYAWLRIAEGDPYTSEIFMHDSLLLGWESYVKSAEFMDGLNNTAAEVAGGYDGGQRVSDITDALFFGRRSQDLVNRISASVVNMTFLGAEDAGPALSDTESYTAVQGDFMPCFATAYAVVKGFLAHKDPVEVYRTIPALIAN